MSLTSLKPSMSSSSMLMGADSCSAARSSFSSRSAKRVRLGSWVTASWLAWCTSWSERSAWASRSCSWALQLTTEPRQAARIASAWIPAQVQGCCSAAGWLKTEAGSSDPMTPWWISTTHTATMNGTQLS